MTLVKGEEGWQYMIFQIMDMPRFSGRVGGGLGRWWGEISPTDGDVRWELALGALWQAAEHRGPKATPFNHVRVAHPRFCGNPLFWLVSKRDQQETQQFGGAPTLRDTQKRGFLKGIDSCTKGPKSLRHAHLIWSPGRELLQPNQVTIGDGLGPLRPSYDSLRLPLLCVGVNQTSK